MVVAPCLELDAKNIQYWEYISWVVAPCWKVAVPSSESTKWHTKIPGSAILYTHRVLKKRGSCTKWGSPCRFGMIWMCTKLFFQPPNAISVQNGDCWFDVNLCTKWIFGRVFQMRCTNLVAPIVLKPNFPVQNVNDQPLGKSKLKSVQNASKSVRNERLHFVLQTSRGIENQDIALVSQSGKLLCWKFPKWCLANEFNWI